jgi:hypothetical protein
VPKIVDIQKTLVDLGNVPKEFLNSSKVDSIQFCLRALTFATFVSRLAVD